MPGAAWRPPPGAALREAKRAALAAMPAMPYHADGSWYVRVCDFFVLCCVLG